MIPAWSVIEPTDHVDTARRQNKVAVVQVVLLRREHGDRRARLLAWVGRLLGDEDAAGEKT
jgi:hypothetical protein